MIGGKDTKYLASLKGNTSAFTESCLKHEIFRGQDSFNFS